MGIYQLLADAATTQPAGPDWPGALVVIAFIALMGLVLVIAARSSH